MHNTLLLVEDNPSKARGLRRCLERAGFVVVHVTTLREACEALDAHTFGGVITDWHIPETVDDRPLPHGALVAERAEVLRLPVVIVSGDDPAEGVPWPWYGPGRWIEAVDWMKIRNPS